MRDNPISEEARQNQLRLLDEVTRKIIALPEGMAAKFIYQCGKIVTPEYFREEFTNWKKGGLDTNDALQMAETYRGIRRRHGGVTFEAAIGEQLQIIDTLYKETTSHA